jgi:hypothetical protein
MMAEDRVTIDTASVFDNIADRQVEFAGEASGERYAFALRYDVLEALAGDATFDAMPLFQRHRARIQTLAADALARDPDQALVVISENDLA